MINLPKIKRCPCCDYTNVLIINGKAHGNEYKTYKNWKLEKRFHCRKCKEEILFFKSTTKFKKREKLIWLNEIICEDKYYDQLINLKEKKNKLHKTKNKKFYEIQKEFDNIQKQIRQDKIKLKIKFKIQKRAGIIDHPY